MAEAPRTTLDQRPMSPLPGQITTQRKRKPKQLAVINDSCTGCAGSPVCQAYCPIADCMILIEAESAPEFGQIWVDPEKCIGCAKCTTKGPEGALLDGCPWDAIDMVELDVWERENQTLSF